MYVAMTSYQSCLNSDYFLGACKVSVISIDHCTIVFTSTYVRSEFETNLAFPFTWIKSMQLTVYACRYRIHVVCWACLNDPCIYDFQDRIPIGDCLYPRQDSHRRLLLPKIGFQQATACTQDRIPIGDCLYPRQDSNRRLLVPKIGFQQATDCTQDRIQIGNCLYPRQDSNRRLLVPKIGFKQATACTQDRIPIGDCLYPGFSHSILKLHLYSSKTKVVVNVKDVLYLKVHIASKVHGNSKVDTSKLLQLISHVLFIYRVSSLLDRA